MKIFNLPLIADSSPEGVCSLGPDELSGSPLSLTYSRLRPNEAGRKITADALAPKVLYVVKGALKVVCGKTAFCAREGEAFLIGASALTIENSAKSETAYITFSPEGVRTVKAGVEDADVVAAPQAGAAAQSEVQSANEEANVKQGVDEET